MPHIHHQTIYRAATPDSVVHDEEQRKRKAEKKETGQ